ncbi:MAG: type II secretion system F family protein [Polyangiaceae bacterium]
MIALSLDALRAALLACAALAAFAWVWAVLCNESGLLRRVWSSYVGYLDRTLQNMFMPARGSLIAVAQLVACAACVAAALALNELTVLWGLPLLAVAPPAQVAYLRRQRLLAIEARIENFLLSLANALKATASIGAALDYTQPLAAAPLDEELGLALKELRLGSSLDQSLLSMAGRVQSPKLDAALASLLIGRQVGGNLPEILETTAATLREMSRLQGVVRSKTAEGKSQLFVLALFPAALVFLFDWIKPNYFAPLMSSLVGALVGVLALGLWAGSVLLARKVLTVEL